MSKLKNMRAIEIPKFRAVSSGIKTLEQLFGVKIASYHGLIAIEIL